MRRLLASLFLLLAAAITGAPTSTSVDVPITITHAGNNITTFTFQNDSGATLPAGTPVSFAQGFRYNDVPPGTYPLIRDAISHAPLAFQWDEISTWSENGGNGGWRHAVWATYLPADLPAGATYTVEFVSTNGTYSQIPHQALSTLCSGPAAHDLKIHLTDVRNQNETTRDSGDATFRICDNIANVGRDAPRHTRAGNVYDEYVVLGLPVYTGSGHKDPLIYVQCNIDIFTKASDGTSAGDVRWVCHMHNDFMNVAAGSAGNAGAPGPVGFTNDPQAVSYRPTILDGNAVVLDWSGLDATINSSDNPVVPISSGLCDNGAATDGSSHFCVHIPSSVGPNGWYEGQAARISCTGTCLGGLTNGQLTYIYPSSVVGTRDVTQMSYIGFSPLPKNDNGPIVTTGSQGTGSTTFSFRVQHYHFEAYQTLDWSGQDNWAPFGSTARVTRKVYPALTASENLYWEQTGLIVPINLSQPGVVCCNIDASPAYVGSRNYNPMARLNVIGFQAGSHRPDLGIAGEFAAQALITGKEMAWDLAREFSLGSSVQGYNMLINEATGRIPVLNNGPPTGPGGNGNGGSYAGLGSPMPGVQLESGPQFSGLADVPHNQPDPNYDIAGGTFAYGTYLSHRPNFNGFTYIIFGSRHFLDMMRWNGNADFAQQRPGPGPDLGQGYFRDNNAKFTDGNTYHYYGLTIDCCQTRGSAWLNRDLLYPAVFGSDSDIERSYYYDFHRETSNYYPLWETYKNGPGNTNHTTAVIPPDEVGGASQAVDTFQMAYIASVAYIMTTWLHSPLGVYWEGKFQRFYEGICGQQLSGATVPPFYCITYGLTPATSNGDPGGTVGAPPFGYGYNTGPYYNGTDASDYGDLSSSLQFEAGGVLGLPGFQITAGDRIRISTSWWPGIGADSVDQMPGNQWFSIMGPIDNSQFFVTFHVQCPLGHPVTATCPTPGAAFTGWTRGGASIVGTGNPDGPVIRPQFDPGPCTGFNDPNYVMHGGQTINGLHVLGNHVDHAMAAFARQCGDQHYASDQPQFNWDPSVVVPGLPASINSVP